MNVVPLGIEAKVELRLTKGPVDLADVYISGPPPRTATPRCSHDASSSNDSCSMHSDDDEDNDNTLLSVYKVAKVAKE